MPVGPAAAGSAPAAARSTWAGCGGGFECATLTVPLDEATPGTHPRPGGGARPRARPGRPHRHARVQPGWPRRPGGRRSSAVRRRRFPARSATGSTWSRSTRAASATANRSSAPTVSTRSSTSRSNRRTNSSAPRSSMPRTAGRRQCATRSGDLLSHISTADAVRDLEHLRIALGEDRLSFVGYSYGTFLGASYADAHPDRVRAFVLDGPVDAVGVGARGDARPGARLRARARRLPRRLLGASRVLLPSRRRCGSRVRRAPRRRRGASPSPPASRRSHAEPDPPRRRVLQELYLGRAAWPDLADALSDAEAGDASTLLAGADTFTGRETDGGDDHALDAFWAISCLDGPWSATSMPRAGLERDAIAIAPAPGRVRGEQQSAVLGVAGAAAAARRAAPRRRGRRRSWSSGRRGIRRRRCARPGR